MRKNRLTAAVIVITASLFMTPAAAWAVQQHGGAEGLVSHQVGHLLYICGIGILLLRLHQTRLTDPGWKSFRIALWLIVLWNVMTFAGHQLRELVDPGKFVKIDGLVVGYTVTGLFDAVFYLTSLDHLVLVPAFIFLLASLKTWSRKA